MKYYIGVDLGTSAVKLLLMDQEGQVVNKLVEENEKRKKAEVTDNDVLEGIVQQEAKNKDKYK